MKVSLRIALRYLFAPKSHSAVNIISMVAMAGIALATAALVVVMSVFNGFHSLIESRLSMLDAPVSVMPLEGKTLAGVDSLCSLLEECPSIDRATPLIEERALAMAGGRQMTVKLRGISPALYDMFKDICPAGEPWQDYHPAAAPAVVSVGVANRLELPVGREGLLHLYVPRRKGRINPANPMSAFRADSVAPSAVYMLNQQELDADIVYAPIETVANLLQLNDEATEIAVYPSGKTEKALKDARRMLPDGMRVATLQERQSGSFQIVNMEKWLTFLLLGFIMVIASFNIISSLSLLIIEKEPNAETLRAIGASPSMVRGIYRIEGMLITGIGAITGLIVGSLLSIGQERFGWVKLAGDTDMLSVTAYPVDFHIADLLPIALLSIAIGLAASAISTRK